MADTGKQKRRKAKKKSKKRVIPVDNPVESVNQEQISPELLPNPSNDSVSVSADVPAVEIAPVENGLDIQASIESTDVQLIEESLTATKKEKVPVPEIDTQNMKLDLCEKNCPGPTVPNEELFVEEKEELESPAPEIDIQNVKKDLYEKSDGTLTINLYIRNAVKETIRAKVNDDELRVHFQTADEKILSCHPNTNSSTFFTWSVKLKEAVVPTHCVLHTTPSTILVTLRKTDPCKKWDSIEAAVNPAKVNRVVPNMWVPVVVPSVPDPPSPVAVPTHQTQDSGMDTSEHGSESSANDCFKSPFLKKPICLVNPMNKDDSSHVVAPGMTGLANLGNTCFMNAVLQCLVNTREFRDYFRDSVCLRDINTENPLGTGGMLAKRFSDLCNALWDGRHRVYEPSQLKNFIAIKASQFSGYAQHDAHEFMAFLLDGLHEDLNRIVKRPYVEAKDWDGRADEVVANESWDMYLLRNDSIVVDLFQGQYKSKLLCPVCSKVSITFDPFLYLAVPLPKKIRIMPIFFFGKDPSQPPVKFRVKLTQDSTVEDVKDQIYKAFQVLPMNLRVFEVYKNRVHRFLVKGQENISLTDTIFVFEVLSHHSVGEPVNELTVIQRLIMPQRSTKCSCCMKDSPSLDNSLKRCTKCLKASYCDQACQKNHWSAHKANCKYSLDLVGLPFIVSLPRSKTTLAKLSEVMEAYARYSVDVFQPPVRLPSSSGIYRTNSVGGEPNLSIDLDSPMDAVTPTTPDDTPSFDLSPLKDLHVLQSPAGSPTVNMDVHDSSSSLGSGETEVIARAATSSEVTAQEGPGCPKVVQVVYGRQRNESKTERPFAMFAIRRVNQSGVTLTGADGRALEDNGDQPLDLASETFLAMDWRNNEKQENYVLVQSKELEAEFSHLNGDSRIENTFKLEQCLRLFTESEVLSPQEAWYCPKCKKHREATKEMSIWKLPTILIVQLKRFSFKNMMWRDKIDKMVEYPVRGLDMSEFYCGPTDGEPPAIYDLYATINHHGGILGGHYTAYARLLDNGLANHSDIDWRLFDDSDVRTTSESSAMARSAYVLFYRRRGVTFQPSRSVTRTPADDDLDSDGSNCDLGLPTTATPMRHPLQSDTDESDY